MGRKESERWKESLGHEITKEWQDKEKTETKYAAGHEKTMMDIKVRFPIRKKSARDKKS